MKENAIPNLSTKDANKFGITLFKGTGNTISDPRGFPRGAKKRQW